MLKAAKNKRPKSTKDKSRNVPAQSILTISGPSSNTVVRQAGEGLFLKLTQHQKNIATQIKFITSALQDNGHTQYRSRHKKTDLTSVVTALLIQLDSAITTTHQCLSKEALDKNDSIKPQIKENEDKMCQDMAFIVRWIDFDSKDMGREMPAERDRILETIKAFEVALAEVVRLVYLCQSQNGLTGGGGHQRSSSTDASMFNSVLRQNSGGDLDSPQLQQQRGSGGSHPTVEQLRSEANRKISVGTLPGGGGGGSGMLPPRSSTLMPSNRYRDSGVSEGSSGASDEERRRSGSSDQYHSGGQSPEHASWSRDSSSMASDWDNRYRSMTTPNVDLLGYPGTHTHSSSLTPIPTSIPTLPPEVSLPPLPGETVEAPPPVPRRDEEEPSELPPLPVKKMSTFPRTWDRIQLNGHMSPDPTSTTTSIAAATSTSSTVSNGSGETEEAPPIPVKKRHTSIVTNQPPTQTQLSGAAADDGEEAPPPIPIKVRRATGGARGSISSPNTTPTHSHSRPLGGHPDAIHPQMLDFLNPATSGDLPPVPMRMESIPGVKTVLGQDTPPPKPPRNDRIEVRPSPMPESRKIEALNAVRKYNEDIQKAKTSGPDAVPPVPLKKKTIMIYKGLVEGYTFDESYMQPLYIPGMEAPPPLPPKKRRQKKASTASSTGTDSSSSVQSPSNTLQRKLNASTEEIDETEECGEVNYLECDETSGYLKFNKEESGGYTLKGGPVDALIAYAASSTKSVYTVKHFSEAFLLTYYTFITPGELISKLIYRLKFFYRSNNQAVWQATTSLLVRLLTGLKQPLARDAQVDLIDLVHQMISNGSLKFAQLLRTALVDKLNQSSTENAVSIPLGQAFKSSTQRKVLLMDFSPESIARQMTILDNELFQKVDVCEMLYWAKEQNEEKSPMLTQFTLHFNNVSQWTKVILLKRGVDMKFRCKLLSLFIAIMKSLLDTFNNFNSYLAILSAIESSPISRLDWPDKILKGLEEPRQLIDNRGSFKNYREAFAQAKPPCIPYIGLYLQDLTFIEMQPSKLEEDPSCINFTKRWKQFKSVDHIRFAQTKQYTYDPDPELLSLFNNFEVKETDEAYVEKAIQIIKVHLYGKTELWAISTEIKPSQRSPRTHQN